MAQFSVSTQSLAATSALCKMGGEVDSTGFEMMEEEFGKLVGAGVQSLILELSALENVTAAALGSIINCDRLLKERGGGLILAVLSPANEGLLELLNLKDVLTVVGSVEAARKMLGNTQIRADAEKERA